MNKDYLGDGVYVQAEFEHSDVVVLTTENGVYSTNTIYLEPRVINALFKWFERTRGVDIQVTQKQVTQKP
jgi:hypothetical protein